MIFNLSVVRWKLIFCRDSSVHLVRAPQGSEVPRSGLGDEHNVEESFEVDETRLLQEELELDGTAAKEIRIEGKNYGPE